MKKLKAMANCEINFSEIPPISPAMFAKGVVRRGLKPVVRKELLTIRVDSDVLLWFKDRGRGYQTQINELLGEYMRANLERMKSAR